MKGPRRIGLIGVGLIAESRVPALRAAGLEVAAVASRPGSRRLKDFAVRHQIPAVFDSWTELLAKRAAWDGLVISTWADGTPEVLEAAMETGAAILVEKPVAWNSARLKAPLRKPHDRVLVGYNRRFYASVQRAHDECRQGPPLIAHLVLPANARAPETPDPTGRYMQEFYESVPVLGLDLTRYVLGDLRIEVVRRRVNGAGNVVGLAAILSTERGDVVQLSGTWGAPANYSLTLSRPGRRYELSPFEIGTLYEGMQVTQPTAEYPIRRYTPLAVEQIALTGDDLREKPGFVAEARALTTMIEGGDAPAFAARLEDALAVTELCEALTGVCLGDSNPNMSVHP
jgi:predicted dehydrogenase